MTLGKRLKVLRKEIGLSQEAMGAQGFVSTPGWIKIENGQRLPSDELIHRLVGWLLRDEYVRVSSAGDLLEELLTIKYLSSPSAFVRKLAYQHAKRLLSGTAMLASEEPGVYRPRRYRGRRASNAGNPLEVEPSPHGASDSGDELPRGEI